MRGTHRQKGDRKSTWYHVTTPVPRLSPLGFQEQAFFQTSAYQPEAVAAMRFQTEALSWALGVPLGCFMSRVLSSVSADTPCGQPRLGQVTHTVSGGHRLGQRKEVVTTQETKGGLRAPGLCTPKERPPECIYSLLKCQGKKIQSEFSPRLSPDRAREKEILKQTNK